MEGCAAGALAFWSGMCEHSRCAGAFFTVAGPCQGDAPCNRPVFADSPLINFRPRLGGRMRNCSTAARATLSDSWAEHRMNRHWGSSRMERPQSREQNEPTGIA